MKPLLLALLVAAAVEKCCDLEHANFAHIDETAKLCTARGGIAITTSKIDDGGHVFLLLTQCAFPCDQRIAVEK